MDFQPNHCTNFYSPTHNETNENRYCVSFTTGRTHGEERGGNFFDATLGVCIPGRADQLVWWTDDDWHGTSLALVNPVDENPDFQQSGIAFILSKELKGQVEKEIKSGNFGPGQISGVNRTFNSVKLDDIDVKALPRATMALRERKLGTGTKPYKKDGTQIMRLPEVHRYQHRGNRIKLWSKAEIIAELEKRSGEGRELHYGNWWSISKLIKVLLADDGEDQNYLDEYKNAEEGGSDVTNLGIVAGDPEMAEWNS